MAREYGADARGPRLHRQGQRPGPLRGRRPMALAPDLEVLAPVRNWGFTREDSIDYAADARHPGRGHQGEAVLDRRQPLGPCDRVRRDGGPVGRAARGRVADDRGRPRPSRVSSSSGFEQGVPVSLDGERMPLHELIIELNHVVGSYGWGRLDMVENRRVGIKSRETYEAPGALALMMAHADLESITLERDLQREKIRLEHRYAELVYDGLWFSPAAARPSTRSSTRRQEPRHRRGPPAARARPLLRRRPAQRRRSLYDYGLATYDAADRFRHADSEGFVRLWGLGVQTWSGIQGRVVEMSPATPDAADERRGQLWHGRFATGPAEELLAFTESLPLRPAPAPRRHRRVRKAHVRGPAPRRACSTERRARRRSLGGLDAVETEYRSGHVRLRGHPTRTSTPPIERRVTELAGAGRRQAAHRSLAATTRWPPPAPLPQARAGRGRRARARPRQRCCSPAPMRRARRRRLPARATPTSSRRSRCCWRTT